MRYKKIMILTIIFTFLLAVSAVSAAENATDDIVSSDASDDVVRVEETSDEVVSVDNDNQVISNDENEVEWDSFQNLTSEIEAVEDGGVLNLTKNYRYVDGSTEGISISKPITIDGKGHTLDGNLLSRIFYIDSDNVLLKNLNFINGKHEGGGGAIYWIGSYSGLINSSFINCSSYHAKNSYSDGGAIYCNGINFTISQCKFFNNSVIGSSAYGGAIFLDWSDYGSISDSIFENNYAQGGGGAVYWTYSNNCVITKCNFSINSAKDTGGAVVWSGEENNLTNCIFIGNTLLDNKWSRGGALYVTSWGDSLISHCDFFNNSVSGSQLAYGGAIFLTFSENIYMEHLTFSNNSVNLNLNSIYLDLETSLLINNSYFMDDFNNIVGNEYSIIKKTLNLMCNNSVSNYKNPYFLSALLKDGNIGMINKTINFHLQNDNNYLLFKINTNEYGFAILNGLDELDVGTWNVTVIFEGNDNYAPCNATATITVLPPSSSVTISDVNATVGHEVTLVANVNSSLVVNEGVVSFFDGQTQIGESPVYDGVATLTYNPSTDGEHTIKAVFSSSNYMSSNSTAKLLVDSASIEVLVDNGTVGFNSTFVAEIKGLYSIVNEGVVKFYVDNKLIGSVPVVNGSASINYMPLTAKSYTVKAVFGDSDKFLNDENSTSYSVVPADSSIAIEDMNGTVGHDLTITVDITSSNNLTINEGYVVFFDGSTQIGESPVSNGTATLIYVPTSAGEHNITAIFNSTNYLSSNSTALLLVDSATVKVLVDQGMVGFNSTFIAEVNGLYSTINEGNVKFYVDNKLIGTVLVVNGSASINYMPLNAKTYTVKAVYTDSDKFLNDENSTPYTVVAADSSIAIGDMNGTVGHDIVITVDITSSNNLTINEGYVVFFDGSTQIGESPVYDGVATLTYTPTTAGEHAITAMFYSTNYGDPINSALLNVSKASIDLSIVSIATVYFSNPSVINVNVYSNSKGVNEGNIKYYVNGNYIGMSNVYGGQTSTSYATNTTGSFELLVVYNETDNYYAKNASTTFYVNKMPTTLTGESVIFDEEQSKTFTTELKDNNNNGVNGQTVKIETIKYSGESATFTGITDGNGIVIYDVSNLAGGMWYVAGTYNENNQYLGSNFADKFIVVRIDTTTDIEEISNPYVNHTYKIKANIHDENGKLVKEGIVQFYLDGVDIGSVDLSKNQGHQSALKEGVLGAVNPMFEDVLGANDNTDLYIDYVPTKAGKHTLTAVYGGTTIYKASNQTTTFNVQGGAMPTTITASDVSTAYNGGQYLVATLKDVSKQPVGGVIVSIKLSNGKVYSNLKTDANGQVKVSTNGLAPKTYTAIITFAGNTNFAKSTTTIKVIVKKATPKLTAAKKTYKVKVKTKKYTATLKDNNGKTINKAKVTLKIKGKKAITAKTNSKGKVTFKIKTLKKKGKYSATVTYKGNNCYNKVTKKIKITVKK